jgi:RimJ/RimL family protein N-acetyltransferase
MKVLLENDSIQLTTFDENDIDSFYQYKSNPVIQRYQGWRPKTREEVISFLTNLPPFDATLGGNDIWYQFAIREKSNLNDKGEGKLVGDIGIHILEDTKKLDKPAIENEDTDVDGSVELGITLDPSSQGKGYAKEAFQLVIAYLFEKLGKKRIICSVDPRNSASIHLLERLGFQKYKLIEEAYELHGEIVDDLIYHLNNKVLTDL